MKNSKVNISQSKHDNHYPQPIFSELMYVCKCKREKEIISLLWKYDGVYTHEISEKYGYLSNNHHQTSHTLNPRIIPLGWVITKYPDEGERRSWKWYIEQVTTALSQPIRRDLRRTIERCLEAANDD